MSGDPETRPEEVVPRAAATLVIVRDGAEGLEVLLTVRPKHMRFMGGASVFPGGALAPTDTDPRWERCSARSGREAAQLLGEGDPARALGAFVCALRESFEEVGLLLADAEAGAFAPRAAGGFLDACERARIKLRTDLLIPAGRWVTPLGAPVRFDARFFAVAAPSGWEPSPDTEEVEGCRWVTPAQALAELASGSVLMAPPTIEMLQRLDAYRTSEEALRGLAHVGVGDGDVISVRVSPLVHVVLAPNPGLMTGPGTNTYIVGAPGAAGTFVIDPAVDDPAYLEAVLGVAGEVRAILVTHRHADHTGGIHALVQATAAPVLAWGNEPIDGEPVRALDEGEVLDAGGVRLEALHCPGHASDHVCFFMRDAASLFAGDNVLGEGTAVIAPPDGDMRSFLATLERLSGLAIDRIYPGHFRPLDGGSRVIAELIAHRRARHAAVLRAVADGNRNIGDIVQAVYVDTPAALHPVARFSVQAHLEMAEAEGLVAQRGGDWIPLEQRGAP